MLLNECLEEIDLVFWKKNVDIVRTVKKKMQH